MSTDTLHLVENTFLYVEEFCHVIWGSYENIVIQNIQNAYMILGLTWKQ